MRFKLPLIFILYYRGMKIPENKNLQELIASLKKDNLDRYNLALMDGSADDELFWAIETIIQDMWRGIYTPYQNDLDWMKEGEPE
jgi:hypothetical protein